MNERCSLSKGTELQVPYLGCSRQSKWFHSPHSFFFFFFLVAPKLNESSVSSPSADGSWFRSFTDQYPEVTESVSCIYVSVLQLEIAAVTQ